MAKIRGKKRMWRLATLLDKIEVVIVTGPPDIPSYSSLNKKKIHYQIRTYFTKICALQIRIKFFLKIARQNLLKMSLSITGRLISKNVSTVILSHRTLNLHIVYMFDVSF